MMAGNTGTTGSATDFDTMYLRASYLRASLLVLRRARRVTGRALPLCRGLKPRLGAGGKAVVR